MKKELGVVSAGIVRMVGFLLGALIAVFLFQREPRATSILPEPSATSVQATSIDEKK